MPSSSYLGASPSSSASSPLSYLIPARPPAPVLMEQGYGVINGVVGVPTSGVASAASVVAPPPKSGHAGTNGHPPLPRPPPRQCPRCGSANTKFCYYNNYSRSQPRYLCKACRRHWTEGGTLRDVPVGGGRKSRRGSNGGSAAAKASSSSSATVTALQGGGSGSAADVAFPDILRQVLFQPPGAMGECGYSIDMSAWQQMAATTAPPQVTGEGGVLGGATMEADSSAMQFWSGWQQDDVPGLDGT